MPSRILSKGRSFNYHRKGLWAIKEKHEGKFPVTPKVAKKPKVKSVTKPYGKKGETRQVISPKNPRFYPTEKVRKRIPLKKSHKEPKIRSSLEPGAVAIVLSGKYRGKRIVVVKRLPSGLVVGTGPFKINGVPVRRFNPAYLIGTSTKIDFSNVKFGASTQKLADSSFTSYKSSESDTKATPERIQLQQDVDSAILPVIKQTPYLKDFLHARFSLRRGQYPHLMKF
eukprot:TRINITY_DN644_c0_g2_i3.p1 TRINITY_DN644_c0_g2~~TRINITY_DN644_c0_g2_i3.p1  ORF type:complete len:226 (+),score=26.55 TRINITY_DN644_c0_g2_i3:133-810(+)